MKRSPIFLLSALCLASCAGPASSLSVFSSDSSSPLSSDSSLPTNAKYVYNLPKADKVQKLPSELVNALRGPVMDDIANAIEKVEGNIVLSPASYLLSVAGLASVSSAFPAASFGLNDAKADLKEMLEAWNFEYNSHRETDYGTEEDRCAFEAVIAHQSVGNAYRFDPKKRDALVGDYISTIESSVANYHEDAEHLFHDLLGYTIPVPDPHLSQDGVCTYGGFKMKDCVPGGLWTKNDAKFLLKSVSAHRFGSINYPEPLPYYKGENYEAFRMRVNHTSMVIVLPSSTSSIDQVSVASAYAEFNDKSASALTMGYVPYFHLRSEEEDLTALVGSKLTGQERFYDALLPEETLNDLSLANVLQTSDFEFNRDGVSGESITVLAVVGSAAPEEHEVITLNVDRPFYAIAEKDGFPLFVNRINSL